MKLSKCFFSVMMILSFCMLSACNLPSNAVKAPGANQNQPAATPQQTQDLSVALTFAVQTIQAATQQAQSYAAAPTAAPAATPTTPIVTVSSATNCRTGPGTNYDIVLTFQPGATAEVVGKYSPSNYWIIKTPTGGTCWLWGQYSTVQGNTAALAEIAPSAAAVADNSSDGSSSSSGDSNPAPPSPTPTKTPNVINPGVIQQINPNIILILAKPSAPAHLYVTTTCTYNALHILSVRTDKLSWPSVSNATKYYIYRDSHLSTTTTGTSINLIAGGTTPTGNVAFGVAAYNSNGTSSTTITTSHCP
jgi:uncharacterized protein YgiM (DUF1202 family)